MSAGTIASLSDEPTMAMADDANLPLVTIITPSFNQGDYLRATLESVAMQDYPNIEHIIMDGGSTDGSVELIRNWAEEHSTTWRSGPDGGQAAAIQQGVEMASGELIAWLNSDDVYLNSQVVRDMVAAFDDTIDVVSAAGWYLTEDGRRIHRIPVYPDRLSVDVLRCVDWVLQPATFFRRDLMLRHPLDTSLHYAFDWGTVIRIADETTFRALDRDVAGYRLHDTGKSLSGGAPRHRELLEVTGRYNGTRSVRYNALRAFCAVREASEHLPAKLRRRAGPGLVWFAGLSSRLTGGRGLQS